MTSEVGVIGQEPVDSVRLDKMRVHVGVVPERPRVDREAERVGAADKRSSVDRRAVVLDELAARTDPIASARHPTESGVIDRITGEEHQAQVTPRGAHRFERIDIEALHDREVRARRVPEPPERLDDRLDDRLTGVLMEVRLLGFGDDTDLASPLGIERLHKAQHLIERHDPVPWGHFVPAPRHAERLDLFKGEVDRVPLAVSARPSGKPQFHVCRVFERQVMQADEHAIGGADDIRLDVVGAHRVRHGVGRECVFGQVPTGAAVGKDQPVIFGVAHRSTQRDNYTHEQA